jgi:hypothetical protein
LFHHAVSVGKRILSPGFVQPQASARMRVRIPSGSRNESAVSASTPIFFAASAFVHC